MSGGFAVIGKAGGKLSAFRQRGYHHGVAGKDPHVPKGASDDEREAYMVGYRNGARSRGR